jgi:hypothetical protein
MKIKVKINEVMELRDLDKHIRLGYLPIFLTHGGHDNFG